MSAAGSARDIVVYDCRPGRAGQYACEMLSGWSGTLVADGYAGSSKYSLLLYASLCRTPVFGILAQKLCDIYSSKRLVAIRQSFNGIVHFWDADWIASHTTFFTESSVGNTLRFLIAWRITLFSDSMAFVV